MKILVVEDERRLADSIVDILNSSKFTAEAVYDGDSGMDYALSGMYDLLILDVMLPYRNGFEIARFVREKGIGLPILMLTAKSEVTDRISGLDAGADYYLTKPFDNRELLACVRALLRRQGDQVNLLTFGNTTLDLDTSILSAGSESIRLSVKEFDIMRELLARGDRNISKEALLIKVWGYHSNADENHVEVYVSFLRKKLISIGSNVSITAIRRQGYHLEVHTVC